MDIAHDLILLAGALGLLSIFVGLVTDKVGAPLLLVFLVIGMLAGSEGPGGIVFDDYDDAYLIGSIALATILVEGGLKTTKEMLRLAVAPGALLATLGAAITMSVVACAAWLLGRSWSDAILVGAVITPTDASAVALLLRRMPLAVPARVGACLEIESGITDPMAVFVTVTTVAVLTTGHPLTAELVATHFAIEMGGGLAIGLAAGYGLVAIVRHVRIDAALVPILIFAGALAAFGFAQRAGASGFLATYLLGAVVRASGLEAVHAIESFFEAFARFAQIVLFMMLGLLVAPRELVPLLAPAIAIAAVLIVVARPLAVAACLFPFRYSRREVGFVAWVGLRGGVPIYLSMIPLLADVERGDLVFGAAYIIVIVSLAVQGWSVSPVAKYLGFGQPTA